VITSLHHTHVSFHTLTRSAGKKSILGAGRFYYPSWATRSTQQARIAPITGRRWQRVSSFRTGELYGASISSCFPFALQTDPPVARGTEVYPSSSFRLKSFTAPTLACFNICTGDIEDAPAPAAIHSFKTSISDGKIFVTADEERVAKANMSRQPKVPANPDAGLTLGNAGVVIVGGGSGTFHSIISLREVCRRFLWCFPYRFLTFLEHGYTGPITVVSKEPHSPIDR